MAEIKPGDYYVNVGEKDLALYRRIGDRSIRIKPWGAIVHETFTQHSGRYNYSVRLSKEDAWDLAKKFAVLKFPPEFGFTGLL